MNGYPLPRVALPDEKQYILEAMKLIQKLNVMDESVLAELLAQFIDGDDTVRELVMALLKARGLMNQDTYLETELDSWETWKLEGDPRRKAKLIEMAEEWCKEWKQRYNEFMANVGNEAKKSGKTVSEIMGMLSSPGTAPIVSIVNFFVYKCREKEELLIKSGGEPKKTTEGVRNAVISMPAIKKSNLMRLGESHRSKCYPERESTLSKFFSKFSLAIFIINKSSCMVQSKISGIHDMYCLRYCNTIVFQVGFCHNSTQERNPGSIFSFMVSQHMLIWL